MIRCFVAVVAFLFTAAAAQAQSIAPLVPVAEANYTAAVNGNWGNPTTWGGVNPPCSTNDKVVIPAGRVVTVDAEYTCPINWVRVGGTLKFALNVNTQLTVDTIAIMSGGTYEQGTSAGAVTAVSKLVFKAKDNLPIDHNGVDFSELGRGLIAEPSASVKTHGVAKTAFVSLSAIPQIGAGVLTLETAPSGWVPGDTINLTSGKRGDDENFTIASINANVVTLTSTVTRARSFPAGCPECRLHVSNLSRNAVIRSDPANAGSATKQGHVMLMGGGHSLFYTAFENLGRTVTTSPVTDPIMMPDGSRNPQLRPLCAGASVENIRGRYSVHFHEAGPTSAQSQLVGSVITEPRGSRFKIGVVNHSSNVSVRDNVSLNVDGSHFFTEVGDEVGDFTRNIAIFSLGSDHISEDFDNFHCIELQYPAIFVNHILDQGHRGHGFWIRDGGTTVDDNISTGHGESNYFFGGRGVDIGAPRGQERHFDVSVLATLMDVSWVPQGMTYINFAAVPVRFRRNMSYGIRETGNSKQAGLEWLMHGLHTFEDLPLAPKNLVEDFLNWNTPNGVIASYYGWDLYHNVKIIWGQSVTPPRGPSGSGMRVSPQGGNHVDFDGVNVNGFPDLCISPGTEPTFNEVYCNGVPYIP